MELNKLSNEAYNAYVQSKAKPSPMGKNMVWAFLVGGLICVIGPGAAGLVPDDGTVPGTGRARRFPLP